MVVPIKSETTTTNNPMMERRTFKRGLMTRAQVKGRLVFAKTAKRSAVGLVALTCGMFF
jgi:hypothetical protein